MLQIFIKLLTAFVVCVRCTRAAPQRDVTSHIGQMEYLRQFGYLTSDIGRDNKVSDEHMKSAISQFQRMAALPVTGQVDDATITMMNTPRCGVADTGATPGGMRRKRYVHSNTGWVNKTVTYRIESYPVRYSQLTTQQVDDTIALAFQYWNEVSQLTFKAVANGYVDITIKFATGNHGESRAVFDGPSGTLAHAYQPYPHSNPEQANHLYGDSHYDDDEAWTIDTYDGVNLLQVAVHEIGHSLGLGHSHDKDALMFAFYRGFVPGMKLHSDDIKGVQALYGAPTEPDTLSPPGYSYEKLAGIKRDGSIRFDDVTSVEGCQRYCSNSDICWAFSFDKHNERCMIFQLEFKENSNMDFYQKIPNTSGDKDYRKYKGHRHMDGEKVYNLIRRGKCETRCDKEEHCIGYTYRNLRTRSQRWWCILHTAPVVSSNSNYDHYIKQYTES